MASLRADTRWLGAAALMLLALVALQWGVFVPRANEASGNAYGLHTFDFHAYFLPRYLYGNQELLAGRLPVWNRLEFGGQPFLATIQPAVLYPPKIACFALFPVDLATSAFLIAHQLLLALGGLLFLRSQRIGTLGAFTGAAFLAFNSTILAANHPPNQLACVAWIPWIFWLADRAAKSRQRGPIAALGVVFALQLLAGYPEFPLQTALLLGVAAIAWLALGAWPPPAHRTLLRVASGLALGALIAGLQLVPMAELAALSARSQVATAFVEQATPETGTLAAAEVARLTLFWFLPGVVAFAFAGCLRRAALAPMAMHAICIAMLLGLLRNCAGMTAYRAASGAQVIALGSLFWPWALDAYVANPPGLEIGVLAGVVSPSAFSFDKAARLNPRVAQITMNVLERLAAPAPPVCGDASLDFRVEPQGKGSSARWPGGETSQYTSRHTALTPECGVTIRGPGGAIGDPASTPVSGFEISKVHGFAHCVAVGGPSGAGCALDCGTATANACSGERPACSAIAAATFHVECHNN